MAKIVLECTFGLAFLFFFLMYKSRISPHKPFSASLKEALHSKLCCGLVQKNIRTMEHAGGCVLCEEKGCFAIRET